MVITMTKRRIHMPIMSKPLSILIFLSLFTQPCLNQVLAQTSPSSHPKSPQTFFLRIPSTASGPIPYTIPSNTTQLRIRPNDGVDIHYSWSVSQTCPLPTPSSTPSPTPSTGCGTIFAGSVYCTGEVALSSGGIVDKIYLSGASGATVAEIEVWH
jgi:hypothetical protein